MSFSCWVVSSYVFSFSGSFRLLFDVVEIPRRGHAIVFQRWFSAPAKAVAAKAMCFYGADCNRPGCTSLWGVTLPRLCEGCGTVRRRGHTRPCAGRQQAAGDTSHRRRTAVPHARLRPNRHSRRWKRTATASYQRTECRRSARCAERVARAANRLRAQAGSASYAASRHDERHPVGLHPIALQPHPVVA